MKRIKFIIILLLELVFCLRISYSETMNTIHERGKCVTQLRSKEFLGIEKNLNKYFIDLENYFKKDLEEFKKADEEEIKMHYIKINIWMHICSQLVFEGLFYDYFRALGIRNYHDMSNIILVSFHRYLNHKRIQLEQQIEYYKKYWQKNGFKRFKVTIREKQINFFPKAQDVVDVQIALRYINPNKDFLRKISDFKGDIYVQIIKCFSKDTLGNVRTLCRARYDKVNNCIMFSVFKPTDVFQVKYIFGMTELGAEVIDFTSKNWGYQLQCCPIEKKSKFKRINLTQSHLRVKSLPKVLFGPMVYFASVPKRVLLSEKNKNIVAYSEGIGVGSLFTNIHEYNNLFWTYSEYYFGLPRLDISSNEKYTVIQLGGPHSLPFCSSANLFDSEKNIIVTFIKAAKLAKINGASAIDINMGSPSIVAYGGGAGLLEQMELSYSIVKAIKDNVDIPVSVKIRLCTKKIERNNNVRFIPDIDRTKEFVRRMSEAGADWIVIHMRIKEDRFKIGTAREKWHYLKDIKDYLKLRHIKTPIFGNGEVSTSMDAENLITTTGCDGVMFSSKMISAPYILYRTLLYLEGRSVKEISAYHKIIIAAKDLHNHFLYNDTDYNNGNIIIWIMLKEYLDNILGSLFNNSEFQAMVREFSKKEMGKTALEITVLKVLFNLSRRAVRTENDKNKLETIISQLNGNTTPMQIITDNIIKEYKCL